MSLERGSGGSAGLRSLAMMTALAASGLVACGSEGQPIQGMSDNPFYSKDDLRDCFDKANLGQLRAPSGNGDDSLERQLVGIPVRILRINNYDGSFRFDSVDKIVAANRYFEEAGLKFVVEKSDSVLADEIGIGDDLITSYNNLNTFLEAQSMSYDGLTIVFLEDEQFPNAEKGFVHHDGRWDSENGVAIMREAADPESIAHHLGLALGLNKTHSRIDCEGDGVDGGDCIDDTPFDPGIRRVQADARCTIDQCGLTCVDYHDGPLTRNLMSGYPIPALDGKDTNGEDCERMSFTKTQENFMFCIAGKGGLRTFATSDGVTDGIFENTTATLPCDLKGQAFDDNLREALNLGPNVDIVLCGENVTDEVDLQSGYTTHTDADITIRGVDENTVLETNNGILSNVRLGLENLELRVKATVSDPNPGTVVVRTRGSAGLTLDGVTISDSYAAKSLLSLRDGAKAVVYNTVLEEDAGIERVASIARGSSLNIDGLDVAAGNGVLAENGKEVIDILIDHGDDPDAAPSRLSTENVTSAPILLVVMEDPANDPYEAAFFAARGYSKIFHVQH